MSLSNTRRRFRWARLSPGGEAGEGHTGYGWQLEGKRGEAALGPRMFYSPCEDKPAGSS